MLPSWDDRALPRIVEWLRLAPELLQQGIHETVDDTRSWGIAGQSLIRGHIPQHLLAFECLRRRPRLAVSL